MSVLAALSRIPSERERFQQGTQALSQGLSGLGQSVGRYNDQRLLRGAMQNMQGNDKGMSADEMLQIAQRTQNPQEILQGLGLMDQLKGRETFDKAGREIIWAFNANKGTLPGNVLADIGKRYGLGAQQLGQLIKLANDAGALSPMQTPMGQTVQAQNYGQALTGEAGAMRAMQPDQSSAGKKYQELRQQGYGRDEARQLAYGSLEREKDNGEASGRSGQVQYWLKQFGMEPTRRNVRKITREVINPMYGRSGSEYEQELFGRAVDMATKTAPIGQDDPEQLLKSAQEIYKGFKESAPGTNRSAPDTNRSAPGMTQEEPTSGGERGQTGRAGWQGPGYYSDEQGESVMITDQEEYNRFMQR